MIDLLSLDHVHFAVPDLARAQALFAPFLGGSFTPVYGGPELNAFGTMSAGGGGAGVAQSMAEEAVWCEPLSGGQGP